ncbi:MAG: hypothetical protein ACLRTQ_05495 [Candidatus Borkfalkia sp.]
MTGIIVGIVGTLVVLFMVQMILGGLAGHYVHDPNDPDGAIFVPCQWPAFYSTRRNSPCGCSFGAGGLVAVGRSGPVAVDAAVRSVDRSFRFARRLDVRQNGSEMIRTDIK